MVSIYRSTLSLAQQVIDTEPCRGRKSTLKIVDYGHDGVALFPEHGKVIVITTLATMFIPSVSRMDPSLVGGKLDMTIRTSYYIYYLFWHYKVYFNHQI